MIVVKDAVVQSVARNIGLGKASGEWIWFVDADDEIVCAGEVFTYLQQTPVDIVVFGLAQRWRFPGKETLHVPSSDFKGILGRNLIVKEHGGILFRSLCNKVFRRSFLEVNGLTLDDGMEPCEDGMFIMKCLMARARWGAVPKVGYIYRRRPGSSLFRYCHTLEKALAMENERWDELEKKLNMGSFSMCKWQPKQMHRMTVENLIAKGDWRQVSFKDRIRYCLVAVRRFLRFRGI